MTGSGGSVIDDRTSAQTREIITFVSETASADLPTEVLHESKRCLLDFLGLTIGASAEPAVAIARRQAQYGSCRDRSSP